MIRKVSTLPFSEAVNVECHVTVVLYGFLVHHDVNNVILHSLAHHIVHHDVEGVP